MRLEKEGGGEEEEIFFPRKFSRTKKRKKNWRICPKGNAMVFLFIFFPLQNFFAFDVILGIWFWPDRNAVMQNLHVGNRFS